MTIILCRLRLYIVTEAVLLLFTIWLANPYCLQTTIIIQGKRAIKPSSKYSHMMITGKGLCHMINISSFHDTAPITN